MNAKHKYYDVIVAWTKGKPIQVKHVTDSNWKDFKNLGSPDFSSGLWDWRIKPATKKFRVGLFKYNNTHYTHTYTSSDIAIEAQEHSTFLKWLTDWIEYEE